MNPFKSRTEAEHRAAIAEMLTLILGNHLNTAVFERHQRGEGLEVKPEDLVVGCPQLLDRTGAIVNSLVAMGYQWDADGYFLELSERAAKKAEFRREIDLEQPMSPDQVFEYCTAVDALPLGPEVVKFLEPKPDVERWNLMLLNAARERERSKRTGPIGFAFAAQDKLPLETFKKFRQVGWVIAAHHQKALFSWKEIL